jgi:hypothetical protein
MNTSSEAIRQKKSCPLLFLDLLSLRRTLSSHKDEKLTAKKSYVTGQRESIQKLSLPRNKNMTDLSVQVFSCRKFKVLKFVMRFS